MSRNTFSQWISKLVRRRRQKPKSHNLSRTAIFERLDDRITPAVNAFFTGGELMILGDAADNTIVVSRDAAGTIQVNGGAIQVQGGTPTIANTARLRVFGLSGNDTLTLDETNGILPSAHIFGGAGNDVITGGSGADLLFGQSDNDTLTGMGGADLLFGGGDNDLLIGGIGSDQIFGETGNDRMIWNVGDGSDRVEGGAGRDKLIFNGFVTSEMIELSANGGRLRLTRNLGNIVMDVGTVEEVDVNASNGEDVITVNDLTSTNVTQVNIDLQAGLGGGDGLADTVIVNGNDGDDSFQIASFENGSRVAVATTAFPFINITGAEAVNDRLVVNALAGNDVVDAGSLAANAIGLTLNGGAGNDELLAGGGNDLVNGGTGDDRVFLEAGDDTFVWNPGDGNDTVEGMTGRDTMVFNGNNMSENFTLSANGARVRFTRNVGNVTMDLNGVERIEINALGGADTVVVNDLSGTDVDEIDLNLAAVLGGVVGDAQVDSVIVNGTNENDLIPVLGASGGLLVNGDFANGSGLPYFLLIRAVEATDALRINGNGGNDIISADFSTPVRFTADGPAGNDTLSGSSGDDVLLGGDGDDTLLGGPGLDILDGGPGNNIVIQD